MIGSLTPGDPLPAQPPGHFGLSDVMLMRDLVDQVQNPWAYCIDLLAPGGPQFGWTQSGMSFRGAWNVC